MGEPRVDPGDFSQEIEMSQSIRGLIDGGVTKLFWT